jgi:hypothetical protein
MVRTIVCISVLASLFASTVAGREMAANEAVYEEMYKSGLIHQELMAAKMVSKYLFPWSHAFKKSADT